MEWISKTRRLRNVAIFGASQGGMNAIHELKKLDDLNICCLVDNDKKKQGQFLCGLPIVKPELLSEMNLNRIYIASQYYDEIVIQLGALGFKSPQLERVPRMVLNRKPKKRHFRLIAGWGGFALLCLLVVLILARF